MRATGPLAWLVVVTMVLTGCSADDEPDSSTDTTSQAPPSSEKTDQDLTPIAEDRAVWNVGFAFPASKFNQVAGADGAGWLWALDGESYQCEPGALGLVITAIDEDKTAWRCEYDQLPEAEWQEGDFVRSYPVDMPALEDRPEFATVYVAPDGTLLACTQEVDGLSYVSVAMSDGSSQDLWSCSQADGTGQGQTLAYGVLASGE